MKTENLRTIPLTELRISIDNWESDHIEKHGRLTCNSLDCYTTYLKIKKIYEIRSMKENQPKKHVVIRYKIINTNIDSLGRLIHKIYGFKKGLEVGDIVILSKDILRYITEYTVKEVTYADGIALEAILIFTKIIEKK